MATFAQFVEERLVPLLPRDRILRLYHRELMRYIDEDDPLFLTRQVKGQDRGGCVVTKDGTRLLPSDNAPA